MARVATALALKTEEGANEPMGVTSQLETQRSCSLEPQKGVHLDFCLPETKISLVHTSQLLCEIIKAAPRGLHASQLS